MVECSPLQKAGISEKRKLENISEEKTKSVYQISVL
jgi:hypothetical protein